MYSAEGGSKYIVSLLWVLAVCTGSVAQETTGTLRGRVTDQFNAVVVNAAVTVLDEKGDEKTTTTDAEGSYVFKNLRPGRYTVRASAAGFAVYENESLQVVTSRQTQLDISLQVTLGEQRITVTETPLSTDSDSNSDQLILRGKDLDALPDDPDELAAALQALAGPAAGPDGGQILTDGFTGGLVPPKESIREVRNNQNPFSAEHDRPGFGNIQILTRPGGDKFHGSGSFAFEDESLNSRNPFVPNRSDFQIRRFGGSLSGPLIAKRSSFYVNFEHAETDDNDIVNARIVDPLTLNVTPFSLAILTPVRRTFISPRFDHQLNGKHSLVARYTYTRTANDNLGVSNFSLPSRAYDQQLTQQTWQLTETAVLNQKVVNETRFQYIRQRRTQEGDNSEPTVSVLGAFTGGGSQVGLALNKDDRWEIQNVTSWAAGNHTLKAGVRLRGIHITDVSTQNFGGYFTFAGGSGPLLDEHDRITLVNNQPVFVPLTSLERYRRTLLFRRRGLSSEQIREMGGGATQFLINTGDPVVSVRQIDLGSFIQDDWRLRPNFILSLGLRYETQSNIHSHLNFAPRIAFAWNPHSAGNRAGAPSTVVRGGFGIFYDRFSEGWTLQARRFNGITQRQFLTTDPAILDTFPFVPSAETLQTSVQPQVTRTVADDLQSPYSLAFGLQLERRLTAGFTAAVTATSIRGRHFLRLRNINAPLPGTFTPTIPGSGVRPFANIGEVFQYESSAVFNLNQLSVNVNNRFNRAVSIFAAYVLSEAKSDSDFPFQGFPANSYDLREEYGRAFFDTRHRFTFGGTINLPLYKLVLNPLILASSGRPFNITIGRDLNGDTIFAERPAFATVRTNPGDLRRTPFGDFDINPAPGQPTVPRNFGEGPAFFIVNLRVSRTFSFGNSPSIATASSQQPTQATGRTPSENRASGTKSRGSDSRGSDAIGTNGSSGTGGPTGRRPVENRYSMTFSLQVTNLLNHTNSLIPVGDLSSPFFGISTQTAPVFGLGTGGNPTASNRRLQAQLRFNF
ncbi:MAG: carboxypeptidase regulatory-like domain-containing protein [Acidobacteria bacterium]|nr:carboxypeptidase regulatory-like domain-containing protein [Acidobacteriota bacterium]